MAFVPLLPVPIQYQDPTTSVNMANGTLEFFLSGTSTPTNLFSDNIGTSIGTSVTLNAAGMPESGGNVITLFRDSAIALKIVGKDSGGTTVFTADTLEDGLNILASTSNSKGASLIGIEDSAGNYVGTDVEAALNEIGGNWTNKNDTEVITGVWTFQDQINMTDNVIARAILRDYALDHQVVTSSSGAVTMDIINGNSFALTLTENVTTITIQNTSASGDYCEISIHITQGAGAFTVTWPAAVQWPGGTAPVISAGNGAIDSVTMYTLDAGVTWFGNFSQAYS